MTILYFRYRFNGTFVLHNNFLLKYQPKHLIYTIMNLQYTNIFCSSQAPKLFSSEIPRGIQ